MRISNIDWRVGASSFRFAEQAHKDEAKDATQCPEEKERRAPSMPLCHSSRPVAATDCSRIYAGLQKTHGARPGSGAVIIADHRQCSGAPDRFTQAPCSTKEERLGERGRECGEYAHHTPELEPSEELTLAADVLPGVAGKRCGESVGC